MNTKIEIIRTDDGSCTLFVPELNETYHSTRGALAESTHVYIKNGLNRISEYPVVNILEIGFGTGLNALLTLEHIRPGQQIRYFSLEPFPIDIQALEAYYAGFETRPGTLPLLTQLLHSQPGILTAVTPAFSFCLLPKKLEDFDAGDIHPYKADLIYYDAFGPSKQPVMWTKETLKKVVDVMADRALLVTYCAQGQFKRNLAALGLEVENPRGALGKREMTIGKKI